MSYRIGVWIWGLLLVGWLISAIVGLAMPGSSWSKSLHNHDSLAAAITAVLGVIWSWFLKLDQPYADGRIKNRTKAEAASKPE